MESMPSIVLDVGSGFFKAGFAGDLAPKTMQHSIVGHPRFNNTFSCLKLKDTYAGTEALRKMGLLNFTRPMNRGIIDDWKGMESIWDQSINELKVDRKEHSVFLTDTQLNPVNNRKKMAEILFEKFEIPAMHVATKEILSLYASGRTTGMVMNSGHTVSRMVAIFDGAVMPHAIKVLHFGGRDVGDYLVKLLIERGIPCSNFKERDDFRCMKEKLCYVAVDFQAEFGAALGDSSIERKYSLPSCGATTFLSTHRFHCSEALFEPSRLGKEHPGISQGTFESIMKCERHVRKEMSANILLAGGNTMFNGIAKRLEKDLKVMGVKEEGMNRIRVVAPLERSLSAWIGGSILASLPTFKQSWVTKAEYEDSGPSAVLLRHSHA